MIAGSMFSGKSEELIRRLRRAKIARQKVQVFKPRLGGAEELAQLRRFVDFLPANSDVPLGSSAANGCPFTTGNVNYVCVAATGVTQSAATIGGSTTATRATQARFEVSPAPAGGSAGSSRPRCARPCRAGRRGRRS